MWVPYPFRRLLSDHQRRCGEIIPAGVVVDQGRGDLPPQSFLQGGANVVELPEGHSQSTFRERPALGQLIDFVVAEDVGSPAVPVLISSSQIVIEYIQSIPYS